MQQAAQAKGTEGDGALKLMGRLNYEPIADETAIGETDSQISGLSEFLGFSPQDGRDLKFRGRVY